MRTRRIRWLLPSLAGPVLGLAVSGMTMAGPAAASTQSGMAIGPASKSGVAGYLRWEPGSDPTTTYNSTGGQVFVTQLSAGDTLVTFAGITGNGGDAQVSTPVTNASCSVEFVTPIRGFGRSSSTRPAKPPSEPLNQALSSRSVGVRNRGITRTPASHLPTRPTSASINDN